MDRDDGFHLTALQPIAEGELVVRLDGILVASPTRHSVQVDWDLHLDAPPGTAMVEDCDRYGWRALNHSCAPNAIVIDRRVLARRAIVPGEEITIDYELTEYDMTEPFRCRCCACAEREVRGFKHLTAEQRSQFGERPARYLRSPRPA